MKTVVTILFILILSPSIAQVSIGTASLWSTLSEAKANQKKQLLVYRDLPDVDLIGISQIADTSQKGEAQASSLNFYKDSSKYLVKPVPFNTTIPEFSPSLYGDKLVFLTNREKVRPIRRVSKLDERPLTDFYYVQKMDSGYSEIQYLDENLNSIYHEGPIQFYSNETKAVFTRSNYLKKAGKSEEGVIKLKIYFAEWDKFSEKWRNIEPFAYNDNEYSMGHPTITEEGNRMYFASDMPGGFGGTDIYVSDLIDGEWTAPVNVGELVNTPENEMFPFLFESTLYFSSNGHPGLGGLDVFSHSLATGSGPVNMGYPVNTAKDDFGIHLYGDGNLAYFTSDRNGQDDIFQVVIGEVTKIVANGKVLTEEDRDPLDSVELRLIHPDTNEEQIITTASNGNYTFLIQPDSKYRVTLARKGYFTRSFDLGTRGIYSGEIFHDYTMSEIVLDKPVRLNNIYYDFNTADLREDAKESLLDLLEVLRDNPSIKIELSSHTDARGESAYNQELSQRRAQAVVDYLISSGVSADRLEAKGYGEKLLLNDCGNGTKCSERQHELNRRTEFKVISH